MLLIVYFELVLIWILVFVVMDSEDSNDQQLPLLQLPVDPDQPSTSRRHTRDIGLSKCCVQPQTKPDILQFSLLVLQLENKALVIVLKSEPMLYDRYQMMFEGCFENNTKEHMISHISSNKDYCLWLQGPLDLLTRE